MFKRILVATDLSDTSERALAAAVELAREHDAVLRIVHVVSDLSTEPWAVEAYGVDFDALMAEVCSRARGDLAALVTGITPPLADVRAQVLVGKPAVEILRDAASTRADLLVLGSHGRGPVRRAFLGSVADRVLREAGCPVLIVRPTVAAAAVSDAA